MEIDNDSRLSIDFGSVLSLSQTVFSASAQLNIDTIRNFTGDQGNIDINFSTATSIKITGQSNVSVSCLFISGNGAAYKTMQPQASTTFNKPANCLYILITVPWYRL